MDSRLRKSRKQERDGAERFGGQVTPGSGSTDGYKNDVRTPDLSIEFKRTDAKSYSLKLGELVKAANHALQSSRRMIFGIEFGTGRESHRYVVVEEDDYLADRDLMAEAADKIELLQGQLDYALKSVGELLDIEATERMGW